MAKRCDGCTYWHPERGAVSVTDAFYASVADPLPADWRRMGTCRIGPPEPGDDSRARWPLTLADEYCHAHSPKGE